MLSCSPHGSLVIGYHRPFASAGLRTGYFQSSMPCVLHNYLLLRSILTANMTEYMLTSDMAERQPWPRREPHIVNIQERFKQALRASVVHWQDKPWAPRATEEPEFANEPPALEEAFRSVTDTDPWERARLLMQEHGMSMQEVRLGFLTSLQASPSGCMCTREILVQRIAASSRCCVA